MTITDKLPPHCVDSERAAVGCALQDPAIAPELRLEWFYDQRHRSVAEAALSLANDGKPIDPQTVIQMLNQAGTSDAAQLVKDCEAACHSPANFSYWRDILVEKLTLRRIIQTAATATAEAYREEIKPDEILDGYEREVLSIRQNATDGNGEADLRSVILELTDEYERAFNGETPSGVRTGYADLDRITGGLQPQQLVIIAARPSVGKTALALNIAERVAIDGRLPVGFFSLEMSAKELVHRLACSVARVDSQRLKDGNPTEKELRGITVANGKIVKSPLFICDRGGLSMAQLTSCARRMVQRHALKLLIVDYLGLLRSGDKGRSRYEETSLVSNALKALAKELNLPVIALAQLNRDNEKQERPPRLSDLRDSGSIEQDADIAILLHAGDDQTGDNQNIDLIIAKQRNGRTGKVPLVFLRNFTRFENPSSVPEP